MRKLPGLTAFVNLFSKGVNVYILWCPLAFTLSSKQSGKELLAQSFKLNFPSHYLDCRGHVTSC